MLIKLIKFRTSAHLFTCCGDSAVCPLTPFRGGGAIGQCTNVLKRPWECLRNIVEPIIFWRYKPVDVEYHHWEVDLVVLLVVVPTFHCWLLPTDSPSLGDCRVLMVFSFDIKMKTDSHVFDVLRVLSGCVLSDSLTLFMAAVKPSSLHITEPWRILVWFSYLTL